MTNDVIVVLFADPAGDRAAAGLAGAGQRLAQSLGGSLKAIRIDPDQYQIEGALNALTKLCGDTTPRAILLANDTYSQEITPRLAHRLGGTAAGDVVQIEPDLRVVRQVYGGKAQATIALKRAPAVLWIRARSFEPGSVSDVVGVSIEPDARTRIVERRREAAGETRLEDARVIVSGGRGIGGTDGFQDELQPLAKLLGAQMAASRAACDAGWAPPTWQVGQTGKKVAPDLYLAIGITGASQHMAGISEAKQIVAINTDPDAPIFKHCRFGIVEDYRKVVPLLRQKLSEAQR